MLCPMLGMYLRRNRRGGVSPATQANVWFLITAITNSLTRMIHDWSHFPVRPPTKSATGEKFNSECEECCAFEVDLGLLP